MLVLTYAVSRYCIENGTYSEKDIQVLNVKYEKEVRVCCGSAIYEDEDGNLQGKCLEPFVYSQKVLLSIKDWLLKEKNEIKRVKGLESNAFWVLSQREQGKLYRDDELTKLDKVASKTAEKFQKHGINTIKELVEASEETLAVVAAEPHVSRKAVDGFRSQAIDCWVDEPAPEAIDCRKAENPYERKYGANWKKEIANCTMLNSFMCITSMIEHIIKECTEFYRGGPHEDDWYFYHDALSLMTAKETIRWMTEKDYYKRWLLPVNGCYDDDPDLKKKGAVPMGDTPEMMTWDNVLNNDLHQTVARHVVFTSDLPNDDPRKFRMDTPAHGTSAYVRIMRGGGIPSKRIVQDTLRVYESMMKIHKAKGAIVEGIARNGHRNSGSVGAKKRGGRRKRKIGEFDYGDVFVHPDAQGARMQKMERAKKSCANVFERVAEGETDIHD